VQVKRVKLMASDEWCEIRDTRPVEYQVPQRHVCQGREIANTRPIKIQNEQRSSRQYTEVRNI
jgi:hypothetical protein